MKARLFPTVAVLLAGLAHAASMAAPWDGTPMWWLQILSLAVPGWQLISCAEQMTSWSSSTWSIAGRRPGWQIGWKGAAWLGWVFATAWLAGTFWWLFISMHTYGGMPAALAVLAVLALAGALALYYAVACAVFFKLFLAFPSVRWSWAALLFAALWTLAELARGVFFTGFPWGAAGYAHTEGPLAAFAPWLGVYGVGAVAAYAALLLAGLLRGSGSGRRAAGLSLLAVLAVGLAAQGFGPAFTRGTGTQNVALLQGNIAQNEKFRPGTGVADALNWYGEQLKRSQADLVVAPETAIPQLPHQLPPGYWPGLQAHFSGGAQAALIGVPLGSRAEGYTNAVVGMKPGQTQAYRYDKHHLVPFGEFIPPFFQWFLALMDIPLGNFGRGTLAPPPFEWQGQRLAPNICYEDLFGEELGARFRNQAQAPTVMVNVSNIAWFGNTVAIDQHLQISRMRVLEFQRPMLRATNTGPTVIIDHQGQVTHSLPRHTRGVLNGVVEGRTGNTPFAIWVSRLGLWPYWMMSLLVVAGAALVARARRP